MTTERPPHGGTAPGPRDLVIEAPGTLSRPTSVGLVLLTPSGEPLSLRGDSTTAIWELARGGASPEDIVTEIILRFDVDEATANRAVLDTLELLVEKGAIQRLR